MEYNRIRLFLCFLSVLILMISTPVAAKVTIPKTGDTAFTWTRNQALASPARVKAPGHADFPSWLRRADIPLENLQPSNRTNGPVVPLEAGAYQWHTFYGSTSNDQGNGIAVDNNGGVYITGIYGEYGRIAVFKFDTAGAYQWDDIIWSVGFAEGYGIAVDNSGGVYSTGYSQASWDGPASQAPLNAFSGSTDIFALKLGVTDDYQWHTFYGSYDDGLGIAVDNSGGVYITGVSWGSWVGPADQAPLHAYSGNENGDIFVLKLDAAGTYQWHTFYGSTSRDEGRGIAVVGSDGVYITGQSVGSWDGPAGQAPLHAYSGNNDIVVLKLDAAGAYQWHTFYGSTSADYGAGIAVDGSGGVCITGYISGSWVGPTGQAPLHAYRGNNDIVVLKLDAAGAYQWHTFYGSPSDDYGVGIAVDGGGGVCITGTSNASWDGSEGQDPLHAYGGYYDITVLKLNVAGAYHWHTFYGSTSDDYSFGIAVDGSGGMYITGYSLLSWDGPAGQAPQHAHSGMADIVVLKLQNETTLLRKVYLPLLTK
jgi:hypothetical protein